MCVGGNQGQVIDQSGGGQKPVSRILMVKIDCAALNSHLMIKMSFFEGHRFLDITDPGNGIGLQNNATFLSEDEYLPDTDW